MRVDVSGRAICWVVFTGDILCVECVCGVFGNVMDTLEDGIDLWVATTSLPPSFNDSLVVTIDLDSLGPSIEFRKGSNKKFKSNSFCPADISLV
jgi:hypothetical protein